MNKKGWLRIVEAFIAIMLITGALLILYTRTIERPSLSEEIYNFQKTVLDEVAFDPDKREAVLAEPPEVTVIENFVSDRIPPGFDYSVRVCEINEICGLKEYQEEVYSSERIISATLNTYNPKKLKIFMWRE